MSPSLFKKTTWFWLILVYVLPNNSWWNNVSLQDFKLYCFWKHFENFNQIMKYICFIQSDLTKLSLGISFLIFVGFHNKILTISDFQLVTKCDVHFFIFQFPALLVQCWTSHPRNALSVGLVSTKKKLVKPAAKCAQMVSALKREPSAFLTVSKRLLIF